MDQAYYSYPTSSFAYNTYNGDNVLSVLPMSRGLSSISRTTEAEDLSATSLDIFSDYPDFSSTEPSLSSYYPAYDDNDIPNSSLPDRALVYQNEATQNNDYHVCLASGCDKSFKRKADLERHYEQKHQPRHVKAQYSCDYPKCSRRSEYFHRLDHFRDHYRDYHKEDLPRKKGESQSWYTERSVSQNWWRCPKCLERRSVRSDGWECDSCRVSCETMRRELRGST